MTMPTGKIQADFGENARPILGKLGNLAGINCHAVRAKIAGEFLGFAGRHLNQARHMSFDAGRAHSGVDGDVLILCLLPVAFLALRLDRRFASLAGLHHTPMWVVTIHAF